MISQLAEIIYSIMQGTYIYRTWLQYRATKSNKVSVNTEHYWKISIIANLLGCIFAYLTGSLVVIGFSIGAVIFSIWSHRYGLKKTEKVLVEKKAKLAEF